MKKIITSIALMLAAAISHAQTTATNFTAPDCNGISHTLFSEVDSGKIIVLAWVMPCTMCISDGEAAYDAVQSFAATHPGRVRYYLIDDAGNTSCASLSSWAAANGITSPTAVFGNAGNVINELDYGGLGMPHIVIVGGTNHHIYINKYNGSGNGAAITDSIAAALGVPTGIHTINNTVADIKILPNPSAKQLTINYAKAITEITILSLNGQLIKKAGFANGINNPAVDMQDIAAGEYLIKVQDIDGNTITRKIIKE